MKRFAASLIATVLAFTAGLVTASSWNSEAETREPVTIKVHEPCAPAAPPPAARLTTTVTASQPREIDFAQGRLKLVPEQVRLKSEINRHDVDVSYPQIVGSEAASIRTINQQLKDAATKLYQWAIVKRDLPPDAEPAIYNTVNFNYDVNLATDSYLSLSFFGFRYGNGDAYGVQRNFALTYDLNSGKLLKLSDIFKPGSEYLEFISSYCINELSGGPFPLRMEAVAPQAANFDNWHVTSNGITFEFEGCKIRNCAAGDRSVSIPFSALKPFLTTGLPGKFQITYP